MFGQKGQLLGDTLAPPELQHPPLDTCSSSPLKGGREGQLFIFLLDRSVDHKTGNTEFWRSLAVIVSTAEPCRYRCDRSFAIVAVPTNSKGLNLPTCIEVQLFRYNIHLDKYGTGTVHTSNLWLGAATVRSCRSHDTVDATAFASVRVPSWHLKSEFIVSFHARRFRLPNTRQIQQNKLMPCSR